MLWMGCGLGKTIVTLTSTEHRMRAGEVKKTLVFGPLRVIHSVWEREARKWEHTRHLRFSIIGGPNERKRLNSLFCDADIYLCNYENMGWLSNVLHQYYIDPGRPLPFEQVIYDEITNVKDSTSKRIQGGSTKRTVKGEKVTKRIAGWRRIIPHIKFTSGLTGTPAANGYIDLHGQYLVVDEGERLGQYITHYRDNYFIQGFDGWTYSPSTVGKQLIEEKISDITLRIDPDPTELPELFVNDISVDLPPRVLDQYRQVEKDMFTRLDDGTEIEVFSKTSVSNKCLQFADGSPYINPGDPEWTALHDAKLQALDSIIEESGGNTVLVGYRYKSDANRIMERYKRLKPVNLTTTRPKDLQQVLKDGNDGKIRLMIGHPKSMGHGVDGLNDFCKIIVWYGLPWSMELYQQMIGRIAAGERFKEPVTMHRLLAAGTLDLAVVDSLRRKDTDQQSLKNAIQRYRDGLIPKDGSISFM